MRTCAGIILTIIFVAVCASAARAATIDLVDFALNINGSITAKGDPLPAAVDASSFDFGTGLGTVAITLGGAGSHFVGAFFDHEIDQSINTFFNEFGTTSGTPAAGQSWELDDPMLGDIFANLGAGTLDNFNAVPTGTGNDVSMALGWDVTLAAGEEAVVHFRVSDSIVPVGFFLTQIDPDSPATLYFSSTLTIQDMPEPGTVVLLGSGLVGLAALVRKQPRQRTCTRKRLPG